MPLTAEQRAMRRTGVGASDVAALFGLGRRTPLALYLEKTGELVEEHPDTDDQLIGHLSEPVIAGLYQRKHPDVVVHECGTYRHPTLDTLLATPDRLVRGLVPGAIPLELKKRRRTTARGFGLEGTDQIPDEIALQVHVQMMVIGAPFAEVALLVDGADYSEYRVEADPEIQETILTAVDHFWTHHVLPRRPPEMDGSPEAGAWLAKRFPQTSEQLLEATSVDEILIAKLRDARLAVAEAEAREALLVNLLKAAIGEHAGMRAEAGKISWKQGKETTVIDYKALVADLAPSAALLAKHTTTKPGTRPFRPTFTQTATV